MRTHIGLSRGSGKYIFIRDDMQYYWGTINHTPGKKFLRRNRNNQTIEDWIKVAPSYDIHYIGSFTDFTTFQQEHPEYFI